jgi:2-polyprenyl-6-methoxyphenol hydroxylase-like FAD-dependent oxidoreductase
MKNGMNVLVAGASFAGLSTAYWLNALGYQVTVVDRARGPLPNGRSDPEAERPADRAIRELRKYTALGAWLGGIAIAAGYGWTSTG